MVKAAILEANLQPFESEHDRSFECLIGIFPVTKNYVFEVHHGQFALQKCKNQAKSNADQPYMGRISSLEPKFGYALIVVWREILSN
jgi:hypothetical protein